MNDGQVIAGLVLAGGEGSRLGGVDKGLLRVGGQSLASRFGAALRPYVHHLGLSIADARAERYSGIGLDLVADAPGPRRGPVAALRAGCGWAQTLDPVPDLLLSVAVDTHFFPADFVPAALQALADGADAVVAVRAGRAYPTNALYRLDRLISALADPNLNSPKAVQAVLNSTPLALSGPNGDDLGNINDLADLLGAQRRAGVIRPG